VPFAILRVFNGMISGFDANGAMVARRTVVGDKSIQIAVSFSAFTDKTTDLGDDCVG
jgi:hypothetical protein